MKAAIALAALALACAPSANALGMDVPYERFATADAVDWVQVCGQWPVRKNEGVYRIVHGTQYAQSFLYLQWMQRDDHGTLQAVHTQGIRELNNDHAEIALTRIACHATRTGIRITARASSGHEEKLRSIAIDAGHRPGVYRYTAHPER
ncbi:hypothetical protein PMI14_05524 [Acidovorax sp. CF316]|uniref:hypothetical protein n=1 Tax=Acidovorax sp. CF316 TaxID=1144317 RepID=UPI00026BE55F|nr:hypothetical protein [Acidovorax sp. CF316]EJE49954.1 hypothetical protein PMI14_05524 [Acidovorax sp. CF316]